MAKKQRFNYLQHRDAVHEILKHKWIESKKAQRDIGFVAAAFDWIEKHGESWKKARNIVDETPVTKVPELAERRQYRRVRTDISVAITHNQTTIKALMYEFNHRGANIQSAAALPLWSTVIIITQPSARNCLNLTLRCQARVIRCRPSPSENDGNHYQITVLFDKQAQETILDNRQQIFN